MWYSLEYRKVVQAKDVLKLYKNISFPTSFKTTGQITDSIAELTNLIPVTIGPDPVAGVDYQEGFQQPILDNTKIVVNEDQTAANLGWTIHDVFIDEVDSEGNVVRTKEDIKLEVDKVQAEHEKAAEEAEKQRIETEKDMAARGERDYLLSMTDKYVIADWPHESDEARQAWLDYRQALRNLTSASDWPEPEFPEPPSPIE